jgi:choline dehydrogenase-like flavoprotein
MPEIMHYDAILIGTGSGLEVVSAFLTRNPGAKVAVIDRDRPGGICPTPGCIPSKILLYSAELVRTLERASEFGIHIESHTVTFSFVMERMRRLIGKDIQKIAGPPGRGDEHLVMPPGFTGSNTWQMKRHGLYNATRSCRILWRWMMVLFLRLFSRIPKSPASA